MKNRGKGIAISFIYTIANTVIGLFMSAYILRMLGKTEYGVYQTMTSFITYLSLFEFGTGTIMTRNISLCKKDGSEEDLIKRNISTIWSITFILSIIIILVGFTFFLCIDTVYSKSLTVNQRAYGKWIFAIAVIKLVIGFFNQTLNGVILGFEKYTIQSTVSLFYLFVRTLLVSIALIIQKSSVLLVSIDSILTLIVFLFTVTYCLKTLKIKLSFKYYDKQVFQTMLPLAFAMFLQTVVNMANNNVDKFVIGIVMSPEAVAVYSVAMYIFATFSSLTTVPISMYMPQIAKDMREGKEGYELTKTLVQPCRLVVLIGGAVLFGFIAVGKPFISLIYGIDYIEAWIIAIIVMIPMYVNMANGVLVNVLDVLRKRHIRSIFLGITAIGNIILTLWWIHLWGMVGAAVATAICTIIGQDILMNIYYYKEIHISVIYLFKESFKGLLSSLLLACLGGGAFTLFCKNNYLSLLGGGLIFCAIFFSCFLIYGANDYEKKQMKTLLNKFIAR